MVPVSLSRILLAVSCTGPAFAELYACWIQNRGYEWYLMRLCASLFTNWEKTLILSRRVGLLIILCISASISSSVQGLTDGIISGRGISSGLGMGLFIGSS